MYIRCITEYVVNICLLLMLKAKGSHFLIQFTHKACSTGTIRKMVYNNNIAQ